MIDSLPAALSVIAPPEGTPYEAWNGSLGDVRKALDWIAARKWSEDEVSRIACAFDIRPDRWARHDDLAFDAASFLVRAGFSEVPRFLLFASEEGYVSESHSMDLFDDDEDANALMRLRRKIEAARLGRAVRGMRDADETTRDSLLRLAVDPPMPLGGDSAGEMASAILAELLAHDAEAHAWLVDYASGAPAEGPFWWVREGLEIDARRRRKEAVQRLRVAYRAQDWEALLSEGLRLVAADSGLTKAYALMIVAAERLGRSETIETLAREGLLANPGSLEILDTMMPPLLRGSRAELVIELLRSSKTNIRTNSEHDRTALANVVANALVAYGMLGRWSEAKEELGDWVDTLDSALLHGNAACLYAQVGDLPSALSAVRRALERGKPIAFFEDDEDLAPLRGLPEFEEILRAHRELLEQEEESDDAEEDEDDDEITSDPDEVPEILRKLDAPALDRVREGLADMRRWVDGGGSEPDLSLFGVEPSEEELVDCPRFDSILERFGIDLGRDALLDLVASLFHRNDEYHSTRAAVTAARHLVAMGDETVRRALVEIYREACTNVDDGHRYYAESGMDVFVEEILPRCGPELVELLCWAWSEHRTQDLQGLFGVALANAASQADERALLDAYERTLGDERGALYVHRMTEDIALLDSILQREDISDSARARLVRLCNEARSQKAAYDAVGARLKSGTPADLEWVLRQVGSSVDPYDLEAHWHALQVSLARNHRTISIDALFGALPHLLRSRDMAPVVFRFAVELDEARGRAILRALNEEGGDLAAALPAVVIKASSPSLFARLRRTLHRQGIWDDGLPTTPRLGMRSWV